jgi:ABC-type transport system involved in cytochrome bd biosynthesis fused ATPase/permease subunit
VSVERSNVERRWPLERVLFALAGTVTLASVALVALVSPWFLVLTAFAGVNQWLYVLVGACPASLVLKRAFGLASVVYPERPERPGAVR